MSAANPVLADQAPEGGADAPDAPAAPNAPAGAPPETFEDIVASLGLKPGSVSSALVAQAHGATVEDALAVTTDYAGWTSTTVTASTALLRRITSALDAPYLLVVHDGRVWTLYGLRPCPALDAQGRRYAGLLGDRRVGGTTQLPPRLFADMVEPPTQQYHLLHPVQVRPQTATAILAAVEADPTIVGAPNEWLSACSLLHGDGGAL